MGAARAPGTNSFNDVVDHIAALTTTDLDVDSPTDSSRLSAQRIPPLCKTNVPLARDCVGALHNFLDGGTRKDRAHAAVSLDLSGAQRLGCRRYISFSRLIVARGHFAMELAAPLVWG